MTPIILTSKMTFFYKKVLPVLWFGFLLIFMLNAMMAEGQTDLALKLVIVILLAVASYFLLFATFFSFVDEVQDTGNALRLKIQNKNITVSLDDIQSISYAHDGNPPKVTVLLKHGHCTGLGKEFSFMPLTELEPFQKNEKITALINRVDRLQGTSAS